MKSVWEEGPQLKAPCYTVSLHCCDYIPCFLCSSVWCSESSNTVLCSLFNSNSQKNYNSPCFSGTWISTQLIWGGTMREGVKGISKFMTSDHPYQILSLDLKVLSLLWQDLQLEILTHGMSCGESFNYLCIFNFVFEEEYDVLWWSWLCLTSTSTRWWSWWWRTLMPLRWVSPLTAKWPLLVRRRSWHKCHFPFRSPFTPLVLLDSKENIVCVAY